jgi:glycosyltransferase involved in cell wall biosynthesis
MRRALRARGIDARLMASDADPFDGETAPDFTFRGSTGPARALRETFNPDAVRVARRALREFDPQIVHLGMFLTQASPAVLPVVRRRPAVWVINEYRVTCPKGTRLLPDGTHCRHRPGTACYTQGCFRLRGIAPRLVQLELFRRWRSAVNLVVSPSQAFADECARFGIAVDAVIPHAAAAAAADPVAISPGLVGFAGRLVPEKGADVLLDALAQLPAALGPVRARIVGDGPERPRLEARARELGLGARVEFLGHVARDEVQRRLAPAAVQVVPSRWAEPFGLVTIEAMARGTPVVASATGAAPELVRDGETGFLVAPGDAAALARCLAGLLPDPARLARIGEAARQDAVRFGLESVVDRFLELYAGLLSRPGAAA